MGRLVYTAIGSLDGYLADEDGDFSWARPDAQVHAFVNARQRTLGTYLYGRRTYELMSVWETDPGLAAHAPETAEFAEVWQAAEKVVFSSTLAPVVVAGGLPFWPAERVAFRLVDEHRFGGGFVWLRFAVT